MFFYVAAEAVRVSSSVL